MSNTFIPEWQASEAVILAWPNEQTDWAPWLSDVRETYLSIIRIINASDAGVVLLCREQDIPDIEAALPEDARVLLVAARYNDTWARDFSFLTCGPLDAPFPVEFTFNGWGNKFDASLDNKLNQTYLAPLCQQPLRTSEVVAEGGALEIDASGHLLSTASCLFNPQRNGDMSLEAYHQTFAQMLGYSAFTVLEHGHLEGDDTDGHIDTLVRFTPDGNLVVQASENRPEDSHYAGLHALVEECKTKLPGRELYLLPLPDMYSEDGDRLPASYANYLICNRTLLLPVYQQPEDAEAVEVMQRAFPHHNIVPVNCAPLVQQYGSLHCISMQVPCNTFKPDVVQQLNKGVSRYV